MLTHAFMQHAFLAGTAIALLTGLVGFFLVLRGQVFAGDALSHAAYAGALAALVLGADLRLGLFGATVAVGILIGALGGRGTADDSIIGIGLAWMLGLGVFFLAYYTTHGSSDNGTANVTVLFGSIFGISASVTVAVALVALGLIAVLLVIARPLLFASLDPAVAAGRRVPVRLLGPLFLALVGATAGEASQAVGALLLVGLLAAPAAAALRLTDRPWVAFPLAGGLSVLAMWAGLTLSYFVAALPASFSIVAMAAAEFAVATLFSTMQRRVRRGGRPLPKPMLEPVSAARGRG